MKKTYGIVGYNSSWIEKYETVQLRKITAYFKTTWITKNTYKRHQQTTTTELHAPGLEQAHAIYGGV